MGVKAGLLNVLKAISMNEPFPNRLRGEHQVDHLYDRAIVANVSACYLIEPNPQLHHRQLLDWELNPISWSNLK